ncbi:MAG: uroporphyrinogen-III synthase [Cypionkella sp.]|uniref:uroporphyrinogen-III synthase n=1 Tax=Cypionkella sp. TaxID=2811411 RepID=UPI002ABCE6BD|nr:uroporphyrinogen-III synthase [Cypionkella sp.]MDZ4311845.1 uroporphyrinogen-III synthase [Cypionkella sp.]
MALPKRAFCVGNRTAEAAQALGFDASSAGGDADDLLAQIASVAPVGCLLLLQGQDTAGDLQNRLISAGIETVSVITYRQIAQRLSDEAILLLQGSAPVILPVFSARSAVLLVAELRRTAAKAPLQLAALSSAVAEAFDFPTELVQIASRPDSFAMQQAIEALRALG